MVQTVRTGEVEVDVEDFIVIELGLACRRLEGRPQRLSPQHAGHAIYLNGAGKPTKGALALGLPDDEDFLSMGEGGNPRYPTHARTGPAAERTIRERSLQLAAHTSRTTAPSTSSPRPSTSRASGATGGFTAQWR